MAIFCKQARITDNTPWHERGQVRHRKHTGTKGCSPKSNGRKRAMHQTILGGIDCQAGKCGKDAASPVSDRKRTCHLRWSDDRIQAVQETKGGRHLFLEREKAQVNISKAPDKSTFASKNGILCAEVMRAECNEACLDCRKRRVFCKGGQEAETKGLDCLGLLCGEQPYVNAKQPD